jgi:hypothetical protein
MSLFSNNTSTEGQSRKVRQIAFYSCAIVALAGVAASLSSNAGVCIPEAKRLNDEDFFRAAVNVVIHDPVDGVIEGVAGATNFKLVHSQQYSGPYQFMHENPSCCRFVPPNSGDGGPRISFLDRLSGVRIVEVSYLKRYVGGAGERRTSNVSAKVAVTSCGRGRPYR